MPCCLGERRLTTFDASIPQMMCGKNGIQSRYLKKNRGAKEAGKAPISLLSAFFPFFQ